MFEVKVNAIPVSHQASVQMAFGRIAAGLWFGSSSFCVEVALKNKM